ncbi:asparaginase [Tissierella creatinophila]|uniref:asparaginase n=1 Tax=Tissierella creatinophila DSM 6911 TaxID=1123403 RepID=A0A1U7M6J9_TISCR|nr:asparaginase [Tissierella creatinophila]OLS02942.1 putative L-asparaginase [Tissierella creatinophila DSM 6911]
MKKKLLIIFTGGTIAMKVDPLLHAAIPALNSEEIMSTINNIEEIVDVESINFGNLPSPHILPGHMMEICNIIKSNIHREDISGVIITHGTDTLEETAYFLDLIIDQEKPIIVVGAMRNNSELGYDGSSNLSAAICTASSPRALGKGVLVVMNNEVNAAGEVVKTNTLSLDTFKSPEFGPLGIVDNDEVIFYRDIINRKHIQTENIEEKIGLIKVASGMESDIIDFYIASGYKGIILEALGRGNIPPQMIAGVKRAIANNIPIVMVSRCHTGRVLDTYGYQGGGKHLRDLGVILGGNLPGHKARIQLMLILGKTNNLSTIKDLFEKDNLYTN